MPNAVRLLLFVGLAAAAAPAVAQAPPAAAQPPPADALERDRAERQRRLEGVAAEMRLGEDQLRRLQGEIDGLRRDREEINRRLVETARTVQRTEAELTAGEERLATLGREEGALRETLASRRAVIAELLAALQRLGRNPPPAMVVEPESALAAVRSAILLGALLPDLREQAGRVLADLERLTAVRRGVAAELEAQRVQFASLAENRSRLELLLDEKGRSETTSAEEMARTRTRSEQLAREARSLRELIGRMENEIAEARRAAEAASRLEADRRDVARATEEERRAAALRSQPDGERTVAALPNPGRLAPAIAFDRTRGLLPLPASGDVVRAFGADDGVGGTHRGLSVATREGATVTAPADGWVVYAGPFRAYGQLVIVNVGDGYHVLLAGMERITVTTGQFVLAGEPVARMGARMLATATAIDIGSSRPVLYVEFRKDGQTIDPTPWWAETAVEKARG